MKYELETYKGLPCAASKFIINGINAVKSDFGKEESDSDGNYGCDYNILKPYRHPPKGVLEKYNITLEEFLKIGDDLEVIFNIRHCTWCS